MSKIYKMTGIVNWFDIKKGCGWIEADDGEQVCIHYADFMPKLVEKSEVKFEAEERQGRLYAIKIKEKKKGKKK